MRKLLIHVLTAVGFLTIVFSVSFVVNGPSVCETVTAIKERSPAMLRIASAPLNEIRPYQTALQTQHQNGESNHATPMFLRFGVTRTRSDFSKGLNLSAVERVQSLGPNYGAIFPSRLSPATGAAGITGQILDHSISTFFKQDSIRQSFVGKAAHSVEEKLRADVAFGGKQPESIQHRLKFQMKASQTKAIMEYRGITNADLSYSIGGRKTDLEVYESISDRSKIVYTHSDRPDDRRDTLSWRMSW